MPETRSHVKKQISERPDIAAEQKKREAVFKDQVKNKDKIFENKIKSQEKIDDKKSEMSETKVSKEHKEKVKETAQEHPLKTVAKDTSKSVEKFMADQKKKAHARSERLASELKRREEK